MPDMLIKTPDDKVYVIDSKVSLKAYEQYVNAEDSDFEKAALKAHALSIRSHVDGLASKRYHELYQIESPDFVLMFIPIEPAFAVAINTDNLLYNKAFEKNITSLDAVMDCWLVTGNRDYLLRVVASDLKNYEIFMREELTKVKGIASIETNFALGRVKTKNNLPLNS